MSASATSASASTSLTPPASAALSADESLNHARMEAQFARFATLSAEVKKRVQQIAELHAAQAASGEAEPQLSALLQESYLLFLELKACSRALTLHSESTKSQLAARKRRLDATNLQSESLLYERAHFAKEIAVAQDFRSKCDQLEFVSEDEFRRAQSGTKFESSHEEHLARLRDEHRRRTELQTQVKQLTAANATLAAANQQSREHKAAFLDTMKRIYTEMMAVEATHFGAAPEAAQRESTGER